MFLLAEGSDDLGMERLTKQRGEGIDCRGQVLRQVSRVGCRVKDGLAFHRLGGILSTVVAGREEDAAPRSASPPHPAPCPNFHVSEADRYSVLEHR